MRTTPPTTPLSTVAPESVATDVRRPDAGPTELTPDEIAHVAGGLGPANNWSVTTSAVQGPANNW